MHFVENLAVEILASPVGVGPLERGWINDLGGAVWAVWLTHRSGVGKAQPAVDADEVSRANLEWLRNYEMLAGADELNLLLGVGKDHADASCVRRPNFDVSHESFQGRRPGSGQARQQAAGCHRQSLWS